LEYKELMKLLVSTPSTRRDDSYIRIHYVRYADDFVIGVEGSHTLAKTILNDLQNFVESTLELKFNPSKTGIIKFSEKSVKFLGYEIMAPHLKGISKAIETIESKGKIITRRKKIRTRVNMDIKKILKRLAEKKFIRMKTSHSNHKVMTYRGTFVGRLINLDHADIIKYYNSVMRGIYNYYDFVNNRTDLLRAM